MKKANTMSTRPAIDLILEQVEDPNEVTLDYRDAPEIKALCEYTLQVEAERDQWKRMYLEDRKSLQSENMFLRDYMENIASISRSAIDAVTPEALR